MRRARALPALFCVAAACAPPVSPGDGRHGADASAGAPGCHPTLNGRVTAPNGDPVPGAVVWIPPPGPIAPLHQGVSCDRCDGLAGGALAQTTSEVDGSFSLGPLPAGVTVRVVSEKGKFRKVTIFPVTDACGPNAMPAAATRLPAASLGDDRIPRIAVATGDWDAMECVLQKLGLPLSSFDLYDGTRSGFGDSFGSLLDDPQLLAGYDIVFINCSRGEFENQLGDAGVRANLEHWVGLGGRLYVTDQSYDYIEQIPEFAPRIDFGPGASGAAPEPRDAAEMGDPIDSLAATVTDPGLAAWLHAVDVLGGSHLINGTTVTVHDFLASWAMQYAVPAGATVWVTGPVHGTGLSGTLPLTTTFDYQQCGRVLLSSYHTSTACDMSAPLNAQERILEYLILHVADCIKIGRSR